MINKSIDERTDVLEKIKEISFLGNSEYATTEQVSKYYEVGIEAIQSIIKENRKELLSVGFKKFKKNEILNLMKCEINVKSERTRSIIIIKEEEIIINNTGLNLFSKTAILKVGLLLKESPIADKIKQELGVYIPRKELNFKNNLDKNLNYLKDEYIKRRKEIYPNQKADVSVFKYETQKYFGNNRVDFYFPYMNLVVEYDEKYHDDSKQKELDKRREDEILFELQKEFYNYDDEYCNSELIDDIEVWSFVDDSNLYFDAVKEKDYYCCENSKESNKTRRNYTCNKCGFEDISKLKSNGKIIRIKQDEEEFGLIKIISYMMSNIKGF
jgi:hypothetical protein